MALPGRPSPRRRRAPHAPDRLVLGVLGAVIGAVAAAPAPARAYEPTFCTTEPVPFCGTAAEIDALDASPTGTPACQLTPGFLAADPAAGGVDELLFRVLAAGSTDRIDRDDARRALRRARELAAAGRPREALLHVGVLEKAYPHLADRFALVRGTLLLADGDEEAACQAFWDAADRTPDPEVKAQARIAYVDCHLRTGDPEAEADLGTLIWRYPLLPDALRLELLVARGREDAGDLQRAIDAYRALDYRHPGSPQAAEARARLAAIEAAGTELRDMLPNRRVDRATRLVAQGPLSLARDEVAALLDEPRLRPELRSQVSMLAAKLAQAEGRFEDAAAHAEDAREGAPTDGEDSDAFLEKLESLRDAAVARNVTIAERRISFLRGSGPAEDVVIPRLRAIVAVASRVGFRDALDEALWALSTKRNLTAEARFQAAILSAGIGDDGARVRLLEPVLDHPTLGVAARYHRARGLEGMGAYERAKIAYEDVIRRQADDRTPFYGLWAAQRLRVVERARGCRCTPRPLVEADAPVRPKPAEDLPPFTLPARMMPFGFGAAPDGRTPRRELAPRNADELVARLDALAKAHGDAFPWLARARDLLGLGEVVAARDEIHEAYLAWRQASGRTLERVGVEAVYRGGPRGRIPEVGGVHEARKGFPIEARKELAAVAAALGDEGVAVGLEGYERADTHPRAHEDLVRRAAARHGVDPNLLFAVMRVESVYQERIVSYAGAIGLMQIMPRTGRLIADRLGLDDFVVSDLLDPATNVELGAWYLSSLLERFDGRLPLAIAAYNGGPHNVRRWMVDYGDGMAVDAFLERIPFSQTHRYVRRVLTHYAAYRAQDGDPLPPLHLSLPAVGTDADIAF